ncbi:hypothetical protein QJQ45_002190 [Haematococcus lacustris]|nr:hypothetical protein QJQ45_002190 [Haematococcus lacustris]
MLFNRVSKAQLVQRRVAVSTPFLRPLICYAAAEPTPEAATTSVKVCDIDVCIEAVVVSATNDRSIQVSTKALELVPGQMKTDKQAVFANAAEGLAQYLVSKKEIMDQRQQALTQLQILITGINEQSAVALATARFEKKPDGTYQPLPRLRAKLTETKAAAKPAVEPASKA